MREPLEDWLEALTELVGPVETWLEVVIEGLLEGWLEKLIKPVFTESSVDLLLPLSKEVGKLRVKYSAANVLDACWVLLLCETVVTVLEDDGLEISELLLTISVGLSVVRVCENLLEALTEVVVPVETWLGKIMEESLEDWLEVLVKGVVLVEISLEEAMRLSLIHI